MEENQQVTKGQLLLTLKNDSQQRKVELSRLQIEINKNNVTDGNNRIDQTQMQINYKVIF